VLIPVGVVGYGGAAAGDGRTGREGAVMADRAPGVGAAPVPVVRIEFSLRSVFSLLAIAIGCWLLVQIWQIALMLVVALVLAGTLSPAVDWLERHRAPRPLALGLILLALVLAVLGLAALVLPALVGQVQALIASASTIQRRLADLLAGFPPLAGEAATVRTASAETVLAPVGQYALGFARAAAEVVALGLTTAVLAFYILADRERVQGFAFALLPRHWHLRTARLLLDLETVVGGYLRGQALTSALMGAFVFGLLWCVGTPDALALAALAAFADLIPFVGGILVLVPAVLATLPLGLGPAVIVAAGILLYQQVESHLLIPRVYGQALRLSAVAVTLALLIGGTLLGMVGALLALPIAAGIRVLIEDLRIDLPGEHTGEATERAADERAEAVYAAQAEGESALAAAGLATALAEAMQEDETAATGRVEVPVEERADRGPTAPPLPTTGVPQEPVISG